jgi:hypothetical protein
MPYGFNFWLIVIAYIDVSFTICWFTVISATLHRHKYVSGCTRIYPSCVYWNWNWINFFTNKRKINFLCTPCVIIGKKFLHVPFRSTKEISFLFPFSFRSGSNVCTLALVRLQTLFLLNTVRDELIDCLWFLLTVLAHLELPKRSGKRVERHRLTYLPICPVYVPSILKRFSSFQECALISIVRNLLYGHDPLVNIKHKLYYLDPCCRSSREAQPRWSPDSFSLPAIFL